MLTLDDDDITSNKGPLAVSELYDSAWPSAGLVNLLKNSLWQIIWDESNLMANLQR